MLSEILYYGGLICLGVTILAGIFTFIVLRYIKHRINEALNNEYGKRA